MYCKNCGKEISDESYFCPSCGTRIIILEKENVKDVIVEKTDNVTEITDKKTETNNNEIRKKEIKIEGNNYKIEKKQEILNEEKEDLPPAAPSLRYGKYTEEDKRNIKSAWTFIVIGTLLIVLAVALFQKNDRTFGDIVEGKQSEENQTDHAGETVGTVSDNVGKDGANTVQGSTDDNISQEQEAVPEESVQRFNVGDTVTYGNYGGEAIEWIVLDSNEEKVLLWASKCIDAHEYNNAEFEDVSWKNCSLRQWLNNEFIGEAFDEDAQKHIMKAKLDNIDCGKTKDKVFILSAKEFKKYPIAQERITATPTSYAVSQGLFTNQGEFTESGIGNTRYWVRGNHEKEPSDSADYVTFVGEINYNEETNSGTVGVRPAIWYSYQESAEVSSSQQSEYVLENSSETYLTQQNVKELSKKQCRLARNEIYARHGYKFKSKDLKKFFTTKSWYTAKIPSSKFPDCLLNIYEQYNVQLLLSAENGKKYAGKLTNGYEEIEDSILEEFSGSIELDFFPELCGKWDSEHGVVSITSESFDGHPYRLLKFEYDDIEMCFEIALEVYYKDRIRILQFSMDGNFDGGGFEVFYYDENGNPWSEDGYEMEGEHFGVHVD